MPEPLTPAQVSDLSAPLCETAAASLLDGTHGLQDPTAKADVAMAVLAHQVGIVAGMVRMAYPHSQRDVLARIINTMTSRAIVSALVEYDKASGDFEVVGHG